MSLIPLPESLVPFLEPYLPRPIDGRPFVTLTYAQSLDSRIAAQPGVQTKLSHLETKTMTHYLRSKHDAILVGVGTVLADDPKLNCRYGGAKIRPVVVDPHGKWDYNNSTLKKICDADKGLPPYILVDELVEKEGVTKLPLLGDNWEIIFAKLYELGIKSVMVEGGARVINDLLGKTVDSVIVTIAPVFLGQQGVQVAPSTGVGLTDVSWWTGVQDSVLCARLQTDSI